MMKKFWVLFLAAVLLMMATTLAEGAGIMLLAEHDEHWAMCVPEGEQLVCAVGGEEYNGSDIRHGQVSEIYFYDEHSHWTQCACGTDKFDVVAHWKYCSDEVCYVCKQSAPNIRDEHLEYEWKSAGEDHYEQCKKCDDMKNEGAHHRGCKDNLCDICYLDYTGVNVTHGPDDYGHDDSSHWLKCSLCNEEHSDHASHAFSCATGNVCTVCNASIDGIEPPHQNNGSYQSDESEHWYECTVCGVKYQSGAHSRDGGSGDACSVCGRDLGPENGGEDPDDPDPKDPDPEDPDDPDPKDPDPDDPNPDDPDPEESESPEPSPEVTPPQEPAETPEPTPEVTETPEPTPEVTEKPEETEAPTVTPKPTATPKTRPDATAQLATVPALDGDSFLARFQSNSAMAADGNLLDGDVEETVTLVMEATEEPGYAGSVLTIYATDSRNDDVAISLSSQYDAEGLLHFRAWQETIKETEVLRGTEEFGSFVELAQALVQALLDDKAEDEVDAIIVAILQSAFDGSLEESGVLDTVFDEDVVGEIVGYLQQDGYEFFLVLNDESVTLLVREIN